MRSTVYFLPPRTSVTDSVGISTLPIFSSSPNARTRDSSDSFTLRSNPENEWMMYHFILGLRGCSATVVPASGDATESVFSLFGSSCINSESFDLLRERTEQKIHAPANHVIDNPKIKTEKKHGDQHYAGRRLHVFARRRSDLPHFRAHVVIKRFDALRPRLDAAKAALTRRYN